jgi:hypothetical protein
LIAPVVVLTTVIVFATGVVLLFVGPSDRGSWVEIHKVSFIVWLVFTSLHVLGHLARLRPLVRVGDERLTSGTPAGAAGRRIALVGAIVGGIVLALVLIPEYSPWTAKGAFPHHHRESGAVLSRVLDRA